MASSTCTLIASYTFAGASLGYAFTSIPATYTDLKLIISGRTDGNNEYWDLGLEINSDATAANYQTSLAYSAPTTASQIYAGTLPYIYALNSIAGDTAGTNMFGVVEFEIPNYSSTTKNKAFSWNATSIRGSATRVYNVIGGGWWKSNSAINRIYVSTASGQNFKVGTTLSLYGISNS